MSLILIMKIVIAGILLQTLYYKFSGHTESKAIFSTIHLFGLPESYGRISIGILELVCSLLLFIPGLVTVGLVGIILLMTGAIYFHITTIGFEGKHRLLALSALLALVFSIVILVYI